MSSKIAIVTGGSRDLGKNMLRSIAGVIASLLSEDNRRVNAQRIGVSGGVFI